MCVIVKPWWWSIHVLVGRVLDTESVVSIMVDEVLSIIGTIWVSSEAMAAGQWLLPAHWGGPLFGVQKANVFTAPKMRLLQ